MSYVKVQTPPGLLKLGTQYQSTNRWYDANLVRWNQGLMEPVGGWSKRITSAFTGKGRAILAWVDNSLTRWIAVGTQSKLYVASQSVTTMSDITPMGFTAGSADATSGGGYGVGLYGAGTYGTPRLDNMSIQDASVWTLDTFGQYLLGCMSDDGNLYQWLLNTATPAAVLVGAPTANVGVVVTPERFVFALGAGGDKRTVQWADQQSLTNWTVSSTTQAGSFVLQTSGRILCGHRIRGATLIFTDLDCWVATYIGPQYVYRFDRGGDECGAISRGAVAVMDSRAAWMSQSGFYQYNGYVLPVACDVYDAVFGNINFTQNSTVTAFHNSRFSEVWWFYPSAASTENDSAVVWNYQENTWMMHSLARLSACDRGVFANPIMASSDSYLYDHETGSSYDGAAPYAETGPIEIGDGERLFKVRELIPDERTQGDVMVTFKTRDSPSGAESTWGPYTMTDFVSVRFAGRQGTMRVTGARATSWRWGNPRLDVVIGGRR